MLFHCCSLFMLFHVCKALCAIAILSGRKVSLLACYTQLLLWYAELVRLHVIPFLHVS